MTKGIFKQGGRPDKEAAALLVPHILDVADSLFVANGFAGTSMGTVASCAHVGKQTLYRRYPDKAALFRNVVSRRINKMLFAVDDARTEDPLESLKALGRTALTIVLDPEFVALNRIVIAEANHFPELASQAADFWGSAFVTRCADLIGVAQRAGRCNTGDPIAIARIFLWGLVGSSLHLALTGGGPLFSNAIEVEQYLELAWQIFSRGFVELQKSSEVVE